MRDASRSTAALTRLPLSLVSCFLFPTTTTMARKDDKATAATRRSLPSGFALVHYAGETAPSASTSATPATSSSRGHSRSRSWLSSLLKPTPTRTRSTPLASTQSKAQQPSQTAPPTRSTSSAGSTRSSVRSKRISAPVELTNKEIADRAAGRAGSKPNRGAFRSHLLPFLTRARLTSALFSVAVPPTRTNQPVHRAQAVAA